MIELDQIALSEDERDENANHEHMHLETYEIPGNRGNVADISISNLLTSEWTTDASGKSVPDFSKARVNQSLNCNFQ